MCILPLTSEYHQVTENFGTGFDIDSHFYLIQVVKACEVRAKAPV